MSARLSRYSHIPYVRWCFGIILLLCTLLAAVPAQAAQEIRFGDMYSGASARGLILSDRLRSLDGREVTMSGFMAPPLSPTIRFFVLTEWPMSICPFCSSDAEWPDNIVVVELAEPVTALPFDAPIRVTGRLSLGSRVDPETGFVSLVRIAARRIDA